MEGSWRRRRGIGIALLCLTIATTATSCSAGPSRHLRAQRVITTTTKPITIPTSTTAPLSVSDRPGSISTVRSAAPCSDGQLTVSLGGANVAAGSASRVILFRNTSSTPCSLFGYPGVAVLNEAGEQILQATRWMTDVTGDGVWPVGTQVSPVTLDPGKTGSAGLWEGDVPVDGVVSCTEYPSFLVTPPGDWVPRHFSTHVQDCGGGVAVTPVVAGISGSTLWASPAVPAS